MNIAVMKSAFRDELAKIANVPTGMLLGKMRLPAPGRVPRIIQNVDNFKPMHVPVNTNLLTESLPTVRPGAIKVASELTEAARAHIAKKNFALSKNQSSDGKPAYPIHDRQHAKSALGFVAMHGSPAQKAEVRKDVASKYPEMLRDKEAGIVSGGAERLGVGGRALKYLKDHDHAFDLAGLGVLAAPAAHGLAQNVGQHRRGEKMKGLGHNLAEVGGLGLIAAPVAAHMLSH